MTGNFQYLKNTRGNIAMFAAIGMLALCAAAGAAIDYGGAVFSKADADAAADVAVMHALKTAESSFLAGSGNWKKMGDEAGQKAFTSNLTKKGSLKYLGAKISITRNKNEFTADLTYSVAYPTSLMALLGKTEVAISNSVSASTGTPSFISINLLIDTSASMGIAASPADEAIVQGVSSDLNGPGQAHCAFACHYREYHNSPAGVPYLAEPTRDESAKRGAKLRIDIVSEAVKQLITTLKAKNLSGGQVVVSIYTFSSTLAELQAPTSSLSKAATAADLIDITRDELQGGTNITGSIAELAAKLDAGGTGESSMDRKSFVVILSDGVQSSHKVRFSNAAQKIIDWSKSNDETFKTSTDDYVSGIHVRQLDGDSCDVLKAKNHTVLTTSVEYLIPPATISHHQGIFDFIQNDLLKTGLLQKNFQDCASEPTMAFHAKDSSEIAPMFKEVLDSIIASANPRLTH